MRFVSFYLLILLLAIPILGILAYWQLQSFAHGVQSLSIPKIDAPISNPIEDLQKEYENSAKNSELEYKDFVDPYGKLKLRYDSSWTAVDSDFLKKASESYDPSVQEVLLFLYRIDLAKFEPAYLVVERLNLNSWDNITQTLQKDAEGKNQTLEIVKSDIQDKQGSLEMKYTVKNNPALAFYSRAEIMIDGENCYLVAVTASLSNWPAIKSAANEIIGSIEFFSSPRNETMPEGIPLLNSAPKAEEK